MDPFVMQDGRVLFSHGTSLPVEDLPDDGTPVTVSFDETREIQWGRFTSDASTAQYVGIVEIVVNGPAEGAVVPDVAPLPPSNLRATDGFVFLPWDPSPGKVPDPKVAGYRVYCGTSPGEYNTVLDVGNVTRFVMRDLLTEGRTYYTPICSEYIVVISSP